MDPVLILILVVVGIPLSVKTVMSLGARAILAIDKKTSADKVQSKNNEEMRLKNSGGKVAKINQSLDRVQDISFKNLRTKETEKIRVTEIGEYKDSEDVLLKGRLHIVDAEGKRTVQDIYLFQPRLYVGPNKIGPVLNSRGVMSEKHTYLCRHEGDKDILSGYVPLREFFSGMRFDYVLNSKHSFLERNPIYSDYSKRELETISAIEQFINIELPRDSEGNIIPVNLNNPEELRDFQNYVKGHYQNFEKNKVSPEEYFTREYSKTQGALVKYIYDYEPTYVSTAPKIEKDTQDAIKVESAKKPETSINDYYRRFDYYMDPRFGERYNCYDGKNPGAHHHRHH